ncbi:hypothetical protein [Halotia branconii]|uniref:Uncharacterized protein n=1 Tax=Halotia branconii CENA392 TaxID=1539056 RepID=A0AAJ6NNK5_9CYAN|nr:hypothetical protein [Halotia branconii]WGV23693.1 hypothetical protein QI031_17970 [Halotia branconii CENA392]
MKRVIKRRITRPDLSHEEEDISEVSSSGLIEVLLIPLALTGVGVGCWVILQAGVRLGTIINPEVKHEKIHLQR